MDSCLDTMHSICCLLCINNAQAIYRLHVIGEERVDQHSIIIYNMYLCTCMWLCGSLSGHVGVHIHYNSHMTLKRACSCTKYNMESEVIRSFLPDLVTAISCCIQPVSDQCFAKGLIPESVYEAVLESRDNSKGKARNVIQTVRKTIKTDSSRMDEFLNILDEQPTCQNLLSDIRKQTLENANTCREVVPLQCHVHQSSTEQAPRETALPQSTLLDRYEDSILDRYEGSIRQHERVLSEKDRLEMTLKEKTKECDRLKRELNEALKSQTSPVNETVANTQSRLTTFESEVETLRAKCSQLETAIEEQGMQVRGERNTVLTVGKNMFEMVEKAQKKSKIYRASWQTKKGKIRKHT